MFEDLKNYFKDCLLFQSKDWQIRLIGVATWLYWLAISIFVITLLT
jgi:hypothetical protein